MCLPEASTTRVPVGSCTSVPIAVITPLLKRMVPFSMTPFVTVWIVAP